MRSALPVLAAFAALAAPAHGQLGLDSVPRERTVPTAEAMRVQVRSSPWRLGPLRLKPHLGLGGIGYNDSITRPAGEEDPASAEQPTGDVTWNASGRVDAIVPVGSRAFVKGAAGATYYWYLHNVERRNIGPDASAGVYLTAGRLTVEGDLSTRRTSAPPNSETEQPIATQTSHLTGRLEVELGSRFALFSEVVVDQPNYLTAGLSEGEAAAVDALSRRDSLLGAGIRYAFSEQTSIAVQGQRTRSDFKEPGDLRASTGQGVLAAVFHDRGRLFLNLRGGYREYDPVTIGAFAPISGAVGGAFASYALRRSVDLEAFAERALQYSLSGGTQSYFQTRYGAGLALRLGRLPISLRGGIDLGRNDYTQPVDADGVLVDRADDVRTWRASVGLPLGRWLGVSLDGWWSRYDSNVPGFDRSTRAVSASVTIAPRLVARLTP